MNRIVCLLFASSVACASQVSQSEETDAGADAPEDHANGSDAADGSSDAADAGADSNDASDDASDTGATDATDGSVCPSQCNIGETCCMVKTSQNYGKCYQTLCLACCM